MNLDPQCNVKPDALEAMVTSRNGYLVVSFLLPLSTEYWALEHVQGEAQKVTTGVKVLGGL